MKHQFFFVALFLSLYACSVDTSVPDNYEHQGIWELKRTRSNIANAGYEEPVIEETYSFKSNGTFTKTRLNGIVRKEAAGTYQLVNKPWNGNGEPLLFLDLKFESGVDLVANCEVEPVEHLIITSEYFLVNTWIACDGFLMEYEKSEPSDI